MVCLWQYFICFYDPVLFLCVDTYCILSGTDGQLSVVGRAAVNVRVQAFV